MTGNMHSAKGYLVVFAWLRHDPAAHKRKQYLQYIVTVSPGGWLIEVIDGSRQQSALGDRHCRLAAAQETDKKPLQNS
jgi:hypothetical protein